MRPLLRFWPDIRRKLHVYLTIIGLTFAANAISLLVPALMGRIVDGPIADRDLSALWLPIAGVLAIGVIEAVALWGRRMIAAKVVSQWEITWRARIYDRLQYLSIGVHGSWESGQLLSRAINDMTQLRRFFAFGAPFIVSTPFVIAVGIIVLTVMEPAFGLIAVLMAIPMLLGVIAFNARYQLASREAQDTMGVISTQVEESVQGIRVIKAFGRAPWVTERFEAISEHLRTIEVRKAFLDSWMWAGTMTLPRLAMAAVVAVGAWGVLAGWTTVGTVVAGVTLMMVLRIPVEMLGFLLSDAIMSVTAAARYWEVMDTALDITDADGGIDDAPRTEERAGVLEFDAVDFRFPDASHDLLRAVSLRIEPGETVALVGATGSGKTALASLVPRLYDVTGGAIRVDGTDVRGIPLNELRRLVSVSFEEPILFSASVAENVRMGSPGATDAEVREALGIAQAADFVRALPAGLDTEVGEQGLSLSGGQRQRLALARAVIGRPRILVLDDPLSAVDVDTEERVQRTLRTVLDASTTLIIAHRPSTTALADRVAVLDGGRIAALGPHDELLRTSALYRDLMGASAAQEAER
ncbi:ABC transporter ATP-binding protein [Brevibacterium ihuae]|uniref:ABC transporter ATP-binding protein n=1 Tax=Brevibacterium ihuae TaxID=1631743 RepID=UPI001FEAEA1E|nr:ABC transporter ATP-binding protein [Brevibacterium ihuae]